MTQVPRMSVLPDEAAALHGLLTTQDGLLPPVLARLAARTARYVAVRAAAEQEAHKLAAAAPVTAAAPWPVYDPWDALSAGVHWLLQQPQPEGAMCSHLGVTLHATNGRWYGFVPSGADHRPVVVINVTSPRRTPEGDLLNPLREDEMDTLINALAAMGVGVHHQWNGTGETGSVALVAHAVPSLLAAVQLRGRGCQEHPARGVFCECGWSAPGYALLKPSASPPDYSQRAPDEAPVTEPGVIRVPHLAYLDPPATGPEESA
jgi:hypothetical protein